MSGENPVVLRSVWPSIGFDLVTLRLLTAAAEESSFAGAAARENISLSAVSRRITDLEARLGIALFNRHDRGVTLTAAGEALIEHLRDVFVRFERMVLDMEGFRKGARGRVRVHTHMSAASSTFPTTLADFLNQHPAIELELQEHVSLDIVHAVRIGTADIGLISGRVPTKDLEVLPWHEDELIGVVPRDHPLAQRDSVTLADMAREPFIVIQRDAALINLYREQLRILGITFRDRIHAASSASICKMVSAGLGVAILPSSSVNAQDPSLRIAAIALDESWSSWPLAICYQNRENLSMAARLFVDFLLAQPPVQPAVNRFAKIRPTDEAGDVII